MASTLDGKHGFSIVFAAFLLRFNRGVHAWQGAWPLSCGQDFVKRGQIAATHRNFSRSESYEIKIDKHFPGVEHWELRLKSWWLRWLTTGGIVFHTWSEPWRRCWSFELCRRKRQPQVAAILADATGQVRCMAMISDAVYFDTPLFGILKSARHISLMSWMLYKRWKILQSFETRFRTLSKSWMRPIGSATLDRKIRKPVITVFLPASWSFWCGCSMARVRLESLRYSQWISMPVFVVALVHAQTQPMPTTSGMRNVGIPWPELLSCNQLPFSDRVLFQRQSAPPKEIFPLCGCKRKKYFNNEAALTELNKFDDLMRWDSTDQPLSWLLKK